MAMQYINQAEKLWKQAQDQWALQQRYQQQNVINQRQTQLLTQQQDLMKQLIKQQQFLQQQRASSKSPELKTIDPFGDYRASGVSLHPKDGRLQTDMNAKEGPGMEAWKEAMRQLDSISRASSSSTTPNTAQYKKPKDKGGSYDNPLAKNAEGNPYINDPNVVDLSGSKNLTPKLLREDDSKRSDYPLNADDSNIKSYSAMSDEQLGKKKEALIKALEETQKLSDTNVSGYSQVEADAIAGYKNAGRVVGDAFITETFGVSQYISNKYDLLKLFKAVNMDPGPNKIKAMQQSAIAAKLDGDIETAAKVVDVNAFTNSANKGELGEAIGQGAMMLGGAFIKSPSHLNPTPLAAIPGTVQLGLDTILVWKDYFVQSEEYERQEQIRKQLEANRLKLSNQLKKVIEEQNRRNSARPR